MLTAPRTIDGLLTTTPAVAVPAPKPTRSAAPTAAAASGASLTFEDVWFRYPGGDRDVLCGLDLHIPAGDSVYAAMFRQQAAAFGQVVS